MPSVDAQTGTYCRQKRTVFFSGGQRMAEDGAAIADVVWRMSPESGVCAERGGGAAATFRCVDVQNGGKPGQCNIYPVNGSGAARSTTPVLTGGRAGLVQLTSPRELSKL